MGFKYIEGYSSPAGYCPFCGEEIETTHGDMSHYCNKCKKRFWVLEKEND